LGLLLSILSGVLALVNGIAFSLGSSDRKQIYVFNFLAPLFILIISSVFSVNWGVVLDTGLIYPVRTVLVLVISGFCGLGYIMMLMFAMNTGPHSLSLCLGESCLVIPYLLSVLFWHDRLDPAGLTGVVLIVASIIIIGLTKEKKIEKSDFSSKWFIFMIIAFILGGIELTIYTLPNRWAGWTDVANIRPALIQFGKLSILIPIISKKIKIQRKTILIALMSAVFNFLIVVIQFKAMDYLVKDQMLAVLYPVAIGTSILLFTAYSRFFRKEKLAPMANFSMVTILAGIILLSL